MLTLYAQLFGGFAMRYGEKPILIKKVDTSKAAKLLLMLLIAAPEGVTKNELIDSLYDWDERLDQSSCNRNLNNVIYRLRGILVSAGLPADNYVENDDGICRLSGSIPLETDLNSFEKAVTEALDSGKEPDIRLLEEAKRLYAGVLYPPQTTCQWFIERSYYYKKLFLRVIDALEKEYRKNSDYKSLLALYTQAASIYPYENWQVRQIRCCMDMYRYDDAMAIYEQTMEMYARDMGCPPTEEMQKCFEEMSLQGNGRPHERRDLSSWKTMETIFMGREGNIIKTIFEKEGVAGAYYCTYPSFIDYCRVLMRSRTRHDPRAMLMFLTLDQSFSNKKALQCMDTLKDAIGHSLRRGDTYTRYGNRHFILMLTDINKEDCGIVFTRIEKTYYNMSPGGGELWYHAAMTQELEEAMAGKSSAAEAE